MSLYNMIHGFNPLAGILLTSLDLYPPSVTIGRFRDASLYNKDLPEGEYLIRMTTRTGGTNRASYQENIDTLTQHPYFLREEDDPFDSTYMYFFFKIPPQLAIDLIQAATHHPDKLRAAVDNRSMKEKTDAVLEKLQSEDSTEPGAS